MQQMADNPELMRSMMQSNPMVRQMIEQNPQMAEVFDNPQVLADMMRAHSNPVCTSAFLSCYARKCACNCSVCGAFHANVDLLTQANTGSDVPLG